MLTGKLRHRVTLQANTPSQDSYNEPIDSWANVATVWGEVRQQSGREALSNATDQEVSTLMYTVVTRYRSDITINPYTHRWVWGTKVLDILAVRDPDGRSRTVVSECRERVGETTA